VQGQDVTHSRLAETKVQASRRRGLSSTTVDAAVRPGVVNRERGGHGSGLLPTLAGTDECMIRESAALCGMRG
jgi:hypothetical protein